MTSWNPQANELFLKVLELRSPDERQEYLERACASDAALRAEVESLLEAGARAGSFLESPAAAPLIATVDDPIGERPGTIIGSYKLLEQIGEGGFGVVFMAEQTQPVRRKVALKVLKPGMDTRQVVARFEAERQALALMDHPNIARVLDGGQTSSGRPYFVMDLVKGLPITEYCDQAQLAPRERLELFVHLCQAVQHAHQKGIIHRDLKPSNVMVTLHDDKPVVKVIDFGIAEATGQQLTDKTLFTNFAQMIGTPLYMSPEQAQMSGLDIDTRSDIFSLGVLLYELLTSTTPFDKERLRTASYDEIRRIIREDEPPRPSTRISTLGQAGATMSADRKSDAKQLSRLCRGELDWIVMKCLEKDRNRRYETASSLAADVQRYLADEPVQACPPSTLYRFRKFARRHKARLVTMSVAVLAAFLVVGVVAGSLGWMARDRSLRQARLNLEVEHALDEAEKACDQALTLTDNPYQWEAVLAAAASAFKRADGLAAQEEVGLEPAVHEHLEALRARLDADENDRRFVARFDEIRLEQTEIHLAASAFKLEVAFSAFKKAFETHYAITFGAKPPEQVLKFLEQRPRPIRQYLVAALDFSLPHAPKEDPQAREWLAAVLWAVDSSDPWRQQAQAAIGAHDWQALRKLLEGPAAARQSPIVLVGLTARSPWDGDSQMVDLWRYIRQSYPGDFWANRYLAGELHYFVRPPRLEEAIRYYQAAIALRPRCPAVYIDMGNALGDKGELDGAIAVYRQAIALAPQYAAAHAVLGFALERKGWIDEAIEEQLETIRLAQHTTMRVYLTLGRMLEHRGRYDEAIVNYKKSVEVYPKIALGHVVLAEALWKVRRNVEAIASYEKAIALYEKAIEVDARNAYLHNNLAWLLATCAEVKLRNPAKAVRLASKAVELAPKARVFCNTLGVARYTSGDCKGAVEALKKSLQLQGDNSWDFFFLAMAHRQLGDRGDARLWYDKAVEWMEKNQPKNEELRRFRAQAEQLMEIEQKKD